MKLINTLTVVSVLGLSSFAFAQEAAKEAKAPCKAAKCDDGSDCDLASADSTKFVVTGMTCGSCSDKVKTALTAIDGVTVQKVCHKSGKVCVKIDSAKTDKSKVSEAITASGFKVTGEELTIPVSGMTCGACSKKVTEAITALEGVSSAGVCHKSGKASVVIDSSKTSEAKVMEAINATGFKAGAEVKAPATETTKVQG
jgi:copper ion binding protein